MKTAVQRYVWGEGTRFEMWAIVVRCGKDLSVTIGNDCAHVGAVAMGCPQPAGTELVNGAAVSSISALGHRDDHIARQAAQKLATALGQHTGVISGVHINQATPDEIRRLLDGCDQLCDLIIAGEKGAV